MSEFSTRLEGGLPGAELFAVVPNKGGQLAISRDAPVRVVFDTTQPQVQLIIGNLAGDNNTILFVCDSAGREAIPVFFQQAITIESDGSFVVRSSNAATTNFTIGRLIARGPSLAAQLRAAGDSPPK